MNNMICSRCKKRPAVIFLSRIENGETINEGLCLHCAKEMGIPQVKEIIDKMGISDEDIENMSNQMMELMGNEDGDGFEMGGALPMMPPFLQNLFGGEAEGEEGEDKLIPSKTGTESEGGRGEKRSSGKKEPPKYKFLDSYCENLTQRARDGKLDKIVGRDREIYRVIQILNRRTKNNPCLIGEPGVGKTAIAEGIAQRMAEGDVPASLAEKEIYLLDLTALVAGTQFRGQFESRVKGLIQDIKSAGNVILFIDEIHNLVGTGDAEGSMNAANILKPALSRGQIQVIGATTFNEYRKHIEKDSALERRFQPVTVGEPSVAETVEVLNGVKVYYERFHRVSVSEDIVRRCASMAERYITDRYLPDKAIDLLDEACSCCNLANKDLARYDACNRKLREIEEKEEEQGQSSDVDYEALATLRAEKMRITDEIRQLEPTALGGEVTVDNLAQVIELWTGIPASRIRESELAKVAGLEKTLKAHIIGQDEAVEKVAAAIRRSRIQISGRRRPASFIFVGPTGVGKTELVKVLAKELFDTADPLIRLDMSEYMEKHAVSRMVGSPPGYVGYDEAGQLTEKVRRRPYSVILFDEIEKAHPDVMNILLQILDEGKITDAHGRVVNFENTVIIMTSNAGSEQKVASLGFGKDPEDAARGNAEKALSEFLRPEFLGRVDEIVVFRSLDVEDYKRIAGLMLEELKAPLLEKGIRFSYEDSALEVIAKKAHGNRSGARDIIKVIRREVEDQICARMVEDPEKEPALIKVVGEDGKIAVYMA